MKSQHDWNLIRLILRDAGHGSEEESVTLEAGFSPDVIIRHIVFCVSNGLIHFPEKGGEVSEPASSIPLRLTEKGTLFLEAIGAEPKDDVGAETFESFDPRTGFLTVW